MKICLTANSSPWSNLKGGGNIAVHHLAEALASRSHDVTVLFSRRPQDAVTAAVPYRIVWARHFDCATVNLNAGSYARALAVLLRAERFDVVHGNAEESVFAPGLCRSAGMPFIYTSHANWLPATGMLRACLCPLEFLKTVNAHLQRKAALGAHRILAYSRFSRDLVEAALAGEPHAEVTVVPPGIEESWFRVRRNPDPVPTLLLWGRMEEQKGIPELLQAFARVLRSVPQARLVVVGEGNFLEAYRRQARNLGVAGQVEFTGWQSVDEIQRRAARAQVGVFPSRIESFGLAMAESLAAGLPTVATEVGALPELIEDGTTGRLVPSANVEALATALVEVLQNPESARLRAVRGQEDIRGRFSWDSAAEATLRIYRSVADVRPGTP